METNRSSWWPATAGGIGSDLTVAAVVMIFSVVVVGSVAAAGSIVRVARSGVLRRQSMRRLVSIFAIFVPGTDAIDDIDDIAVLHRRRRRPRWARSRSRRRYTACARCVRRSTKYATAGGRSARHERYRRHSLQISETFAAPGFRPLLPPSSTSVCLQTFWLPDGVSCAEIHDRLKDRGFVIYAGQGPLAKRTVRIALMGDLHDDDIDRLTSALQELA